MLCLHFDRASGLLAPLHSFGLSALLQWEGGIRVNAFVSGGFLPAAARGSTVRGLMAGWDWLATWAHLGGVTDITDHKAAAAGLPPVDSLNMWPLISGSNGTSPRTEIVVGSNVGGDESGRTSGVTTVAALIRPPWKILLGEGPGDILDMAGHPGPQVRARSVFCGFVGVIVATLKGAKPMVCIPHSSEQQSNCVRAQMRPV